MAVTAAPFSAYLVQRGLRTSKIRMDHCFKSGLEVAKWLEKRPEVEKIFYPALESDPGHELWKRDFTGSCGLFSVLFKQTSELKLAQYTDSLEMFGLGVSWGGFESLALLVCPKASRTAKPWTETGSLVRFSIGNENRQDLIADLTQAMKRLD